jgi:hypothetical protein
MILLIFSKSQYIIFRLGLHFFLTLHFNFSSQVTFVPQRLHTILLCILGILKLEDLLAKVRSPKRYLAEMQNQFGPDLDPRQFPASQDAFNSIIKSQKNRVSQESKGLNTLEEQVFCRKRNEFLTAVEKGYNKLRDNALGVDKP